MRSQVWLEALENNVAAVKEILEGVTEAALRRTPAPDEWSAHDVMCHLVVNEMNTASTVRRMLTEDSPMAAEIDDGRVDRFSPIYATTSSAFELWRALREDTVRLAESLDPAELGRPGSVMHFGEPMMRTVQEYLEGRTRHDRDHIDQMRTALAAR